MPPVKEKTCDPTWNVVHATVLLYSLPFVGLWVCEYFYGNPFVDKDFIIASLWGFFIPFLCTKNAAGHAFTFKDYMFRDFYPVTISLLHGVFWFLCLHTFTVWFAALVFGLGFFIYDWVMIQRRILLVYVVPLWIHQKGSFAVVCTFGIVWWTYVSGMLALAHVYIPDGPLEIVLWTLGMVLPMVLLSIWWNLWIMPPLHIRGVRKVAVIGGGWSGIVTTKWCSQYGLQPMLFEAADSLGGVWEYNEEKKGGVFLHTRATSSKHFIHASDFPMEESASDFPSHMEMLQYIKYYIEHFELTRFIRLGERVMHVEKKEDHWLVDVVSSDGTNTTYTFDAVVVCTGPHGKPCLDTYHHPLYSSFKGDIMHATEYKNSSAIEKNQCVVVLGAGESAADIIAECASTTNTEIHWCTRGGQWFADRNLGPFPADHFTATGIRCFVGMFGISELLIRRVVAFLIFTAWGRGGHGLSKWIPSAPYLHQAINKSRDGILQVYRGRIKIHGEVTKVKGSQVWFKGEKCSIKTDKLVVCTGYVPHWPFLELKPTSLFNKVFTITDPTLAFVGLARPVLGSIFATSEAQSRYVAHKLASKSVLPHESKMKVALYYEQLDHAKRFQESSPMNQLVDHEVYCTTLMKSIGMQVRWEKIAITQPRLFWLLCWSPWISCKYLLSSADKTTRQTCEEWIRREMPHKDHPVHMFTCSILTLGVALCFCLIFALCTITVGNLAAIIAVILTAVAILLRCGFG